VFIGRLESRLDSQRQAIGKKLHAHAEAVALQTSASSGTTLGGAHACGVGAATR
jgi:hypothetical protein